MIVVVSYDLKSVRDYAQFFEALKQQGTWWHYLTTTWLISGPKTPQQITDALHPYMDPQDFLLAVEMGNQVQGYLPKEAWDWINSERAKSAPNVFTLGLGLGQNPPPPLLPPPVTFNPFFPPKPKK